MRLNKYYFLLFLLLFIFSSALQASDKLTSDSGLVDPEGTAKRKAFHFGVHLAGSVNYFDHGTLGLLDISPHYDWGGNFGFAFDWEVSRFNNIRFEPFYEYQRLKNESKDEFNRSSFTSTNHAAGINFFPIIITAGNSFKPAIALGGQFKYLLSNDMQASLNGRTLDLHSMDAKPVQYGLIVGIGAYIGRTLLEVRMHKSLVNYIDHSTADNAVNQMKLVINL